MMLDGKRIVVLGGSSGIGLAIAQSAAREGAAVVIASSQQAKVDAALGTMPGAQGYAVDVSEAASIQALFGRIGAFDHLAYTAGETLALGSLADIDPASAQRFFSVRYWGAFFAAKYSAPSVRPGGSIVFTSGTAGRRPRSGWALGASICMAMEGLTRALAVELAPTRVNLVVPGFVKTPLWAGMAEADREAMYQRAGPFTPRRPCGGARGDRRGLSVFHAPELQHRAVGGGGWRRRARVRGNGHPTGSRARVA